MKKRLLPIILVLPCAAFLNGSCGTSRHLAPDPPTEPEPEYVEYSLVTPIISKYLSEVSYTDGDYSYSLVQNYTSQPQTYQTHWPAPVPFKWIPTEGAVSQKITFTSEQESFTYTFPGGTSKAEIYNLVPDRKYTCTVECTDAIGKVTKLDPQYIKTLPGRRFIRVDGVYNIRDLGGMKTGDGKTIRYGRIYRGGEAQGTHKLNITKSGREQFAQLGIGADLDLRRAMDALDITESPYQEGIHYRRFNDCNLYSYKKILEGGEYIRAFRYLVKELMTNPDKGVYFHCYAGADRTGTLAFLVEGLLGVSESELAKDYELTSFSTPPGARPRVGNNSRTYPGMVSVIKSLPGDSFKDKFYYYLSSGIVADGEKIGTQPVDTLEWFRNYMLEK